ncbi:hypothetical protein [uncultured Megasphaera sp.]|uniref:hypothetical protein n=1 Tax=uncultured Megasphaera sp. TaxID=165188 RepID=UPI00265B4318|nr:hypothetical protein [uncultured Megasphaera sp.]
MAAVACITLLLLLILTAASVPLTYQVLVHIKSPFYMEGTLCWLGHMLHYTWQYTYGEKPVTSFSIAGKERQSAPAEETITEEQCAAAAEEVEKTARTLTYEKLRSSAKTSPPSKSGKSVTQLLLREDMLLACWRWFDCALLSARIRQFTIRGSLGLAQPHETGMLAGFLYTVMPDSIEDLHFNFTEKQYDCTAQGQGKLYPSVFILATLSFLVSSPVRRLLGQYYTSRREKHHG